MYMCVAYVCKCVYMCVSVYMCVWRMCVCVHNYDTYQDFVDATSLWQVLPCVNDASRATTERRLEGEREGRYRHYKDHMTVT